MDERKSVPAPNPPEVLQHHMLPPAPPGWFNSSSEASFMPPPVVVQPGVPGVQNQINTQPASNNWISAPSQAINCPPGLEYLSAIDQLLVHQKVELFEVFSGFEFKNRYIVKNTIGQYVYWAMEESESFGRQCYGAAREFDMKILDLYHNEVLHFYRPLRCQCCCYPCCLQEMEISSPPGNIIGKVVQNWSLLKTSFDIQDQTGDTILKIKGPCRTVCCRCSDVIFQVETPDGTAVGQVTKQWTGWEREAYTKADNFSINFPMDLDVRVKATLLGALFLIDYMYFEHAPNRR